MTEANIYMHIISQQNTLSDRHSNNYHENTILCTVNQLQKNSEKTHTGAKK